MIRRVGNISVNHLSELKSSISQCTICEPELPLGAHPVVQIYSQAKILVIGQAPGIKVHQTGIPFNDPSGERLRDWMGIDKECFYESGYIAITPMGFCYPGKGRSGDLPPRKECAKTWHSEVMSFLTEVQLVLLIGKYSQEYYLSDKNNLTQRVMSWRNYLPRYFPLPHPSPRNNIWLSKNKWFERDVIPDLKQRVKKIIGKSV